MSDEAPGPQPVEYRFRGFPSKDAGVVIDRAAGTVRFDHCFQTYRFLGPVETTVTFPIDDLLDTHRQRYKGETLTILLGCGKAVVIREGKAFLPLCDLLDELIPPGRQGPELANPWILYAAVTAAMAGAVGGWFATPQNGGDPLLLANMAGLACLSVFAVFVLVFAAQRLFGIQLATPLGTSVFGVYAGGPIAMLCLVQDLVDGWGMIAIICGCCLASAWIGVYLMQRKEARREAAWRRAGKAAGDAWDREALT